MERDSLTKVLVVDDEQGIRDLLSDILVDAGYEVIEADDGHVALEAARQQQPDVVLLDIIMPTMNGLEVLASLRESPATERIPVVLLTALQAQSGESEGIRLGAVHYMNKPWKPGSVELAVRVALREGAGGL